MNFQTININLIYDRHFAQIKETEDYIAVKTPDRPNFFWGNYLKMKKSPEENDYSKWLGFFEKEIGTIQEKGFVAINFDSIPGQMCNLEEFSQNGFSINHSEILSTSKLNQPRKRNSEIEIREFSTDEDWEAYVDIHFEPNWGYSDDESQKNFLRSEVKAFQKIVAKGCGSRFGAFVGDKMVGELGVYWQDEICVFHNVGTHREHCRKGICQTLIFEISKKMIVRPDINLLAMEAEEDYHATKIYQSLGFKPYHKIVSLEWKDERFS